LHAERAAIDGNPFIGMFARCSDRFALIPRAAPEKFAAKCRGALGVDVLEAGVAGSNLIGLFSAMNSNGLVLTGLAYREEARELKRGLGMNVAMLKGKLTAVGNDVLANDRAALVDPAMSAADARAVGDCLGVEVLKRDIAGLATVGSAAVVTNRGLLVHGEVDDEEMEELEGIFGVKGSSGTANMGIPYVGLCVVANSNGYIFGERTSGFELARIDEALGMIGRR